ncbi:AAA family ATPase [Agrobacterium tumefaciens]|uniref:AAA family ATPase n=1 Tax=Agrobacterium tumefaciens TaxID=358 RepID=UPI0015742B64|nr:AAA family ATPase [Agrobacterium tumefaciens]NTE34874.1 AAA family ATPase [Agrobacterium tumefaciens]NTE50384.1 AAA family ATPase [Agrobacterium tumefaciens]
MEEKNTGVVEDERAEWEAYREHHERDMTEERAEMALHADFTDYMKPDPDDWDHDTVPERESLKSDKAYRSTSSERQDMESEYKPLASVLPSDWDDADVPHREWFWDGLMPLGQVSILTAEGGTGKSLVGAQAGVTSALRITEFLGRRIMGGPVIYLAAEDDEDEFKRRLHDVARHNGVKRSEIDDFHLIPMADQEPVLSEPDRHGTMQPTETWFRLVETVRCVQPVALFLDTAADLFGGDEIKRSQVRQFVAMLRSLAILENCAVVLLYHPSRTGIENGRGESGSTAWFNSVRAAVFMTAEQGDETGNLRRIKNTKANYGKKGEGFLVRWEKGVFVLVDPNAPPTPEEIKRRADCKLEFMSRFLAHTSSARSTRLSEGTQGKYSAVKQLLATKGTGDYSRRDFERALKDLLDDGKLEFVTNRANGRDESNLVIKAFPAPQYGEEK